MLQILSNFVIRLQKNIFPHLLYLFIKSTANPFVDIILAFISGSSCLALISISLALFEVIILLKLISLLVFFEKLVISGILILLAKSACFNLVAKFSKC